MKRKLLCGLLAALVLSAGTVRAAPSGRVPLGPGTLYTILAKFQEEGLIRETAVEGRRRTYAITDRGRALFRQELSRLRLCVGDGEREERAAERALPGTERRELP